MARRRRGERVLGPYSNRRGGRTIGWRVVSIDEQGKRSTDYFATRKKAEVYAAILRAKVGEGTLSEVVDRYEIHMVEKGNKVRSAATTAARIRAFFADDRLPMYALTGAKIQQAYDRRRTEVPSADTHRNELSEVKTFVRWAFRKGLVQKALVEGLDGVEGVGKRKRGKPQLRVDEAREWMAVALKLAEREDGAVAALCCFILAMRTTEVVSRVARDVDDGGKLLWIPDSKTEAGKRCIEVPPALQPHLLRLSRGKKPDQLLFGQHWRDWPRKWVQRICREAKVPVVTAHGMRGTHSTLATRAGASSLVVAATLGHSSPSVTEQFYTDRSATVAARQNRVLRVIEGGVSPGRRAENGPQESTDGGSNDSENIVATGVQTKKGGLETGAIYSS